MVIGLFIIGALLHIRKTNKVAELCWEDAQLTEKNNGINPESFTPGDKEKPWLFAGAPCTKSEEKNLVISHLPVFFRRYLVLCLFTLPYLALKVCFSSLLKGRWYYKPNITDDQIFDYFTNSVLVLICDINNEEGTLTLKTPKEFPLVSDAGLKYADFNIELNIKDKKINKASLAGKDLTGDNDLISTLVINLVVHWGHAVGHVISEKSAREIAAKKVDTLKLSNRFVTGLHDALLYSIYSPFESGQFFSSGINPESLIESLKFDAKLVNDDGKMQFRYYRFVHLSEPLIGKHLEKHDLNVNANDLFQNMVKHSVEHYLSYKTAGKISAWTMDGSKSVRSYYTSKIFWSIWMPDLSGWVVQEKIGKLDEKKHPFYTGLHRDLTKIDKELADCIVCSTSF